MNRDSGTDDALDVDRVGAILVECLGFAVRRVVNDRLGDHWSATSRAPAHPDVFGRNMDDIHPGPGRSPARSRPLDRLYRQLAECGAERAREIAAALARRVTRSGPVDQ